ncbi:hypothetical protein CHINAEXTREME_00940 [Halobiforma lacisalsi AJ5]|uniref:Uncharacterized protein n=1 Tax=Natronobacterium lacisalsi AJ5 TaxID=358396 RepID=M0LE03_NATLA|nr:hypothetical protein CHINAEXTREME_00940 [Halobiforma lacisalsi AJ5]EMA31816.1 hypothetical protein C445_13415 [Halobiforma lacisalsi AJ5]
MYRNRGAAGNTFSLPFVASSLLAARLSAVASVGIPSTRSTPLETPSFPDRKSAEGSSNGVHCFRNLKYVES